MACALVSLGMQATKSEPPRASSSPNPLQASSSPLPMMLCYVRALCRVLLLLACSLSLPNTKCDALHLRRHTASYHVYFRSPSLPRRATSGGRHTIRHGGLWWPVSPARVVAARGQPERTVLRQLRDVVKGRALILQEPQACLLDVLHTRTSSSTSVRRASGVRRKAASTPGQRG